MDDTVVQQEKTRMPQASLHARTHNYLDAWTRTCAVQVLSSGLASVEGALSEADIAQLDDVFNFVDSDKNGVISEKEVSASDAPFGCRLLSQSRPINLGEGVVCNSAQYDVTQAQARTGPRHPRMVETFVPGSPLIVI